MHPSSVGARSAWWVAAGSEPGAASAAPPQLHEAYAEHQAELPRLPIPPLDETLERFMRAATPLLALRGGTAAVNDAAAMVASFGAAEGAALDSKLREWDEGPARDGSYLESAWYRLAYLGSRVPVPINSNPAMVLREPAGSEGSQLWRAATLLAGAAEFAAELRSGSLPAASARGIPFCMSMFPAVLGTARLPETGCDRMRCSPSSTHAAVGWRGEWYSLPLFGADGAPHPPPLLYAALRRLAQQRPAGGGGGGGGGSLGALTAAPRDEWAKARESLWRASASNRASLEAMDTALLVLCLDGAAPPAGESVARAVLVGSGSQRWFDKLCAIVFSDGTAGINFEHSPVDGAQVSFLVERMYGCGLRFPSAPPAAAEPAGAPEAILLQWRLPPPLSSAVSAAAAQHAERDAALELAPLSVGCLGTEWAKAHGAPLDSLVQLSVQLAWARLDEGGLRSVYQACSTLAFSHGRTEVIRSVTSETAALVAELLRDEASPRLPELLAAAVRSHREVVRDCQRGHGHERHLLALYALSASSGAPTPALFLHQAWSEVSASTISTSGARQPSVASFSFGPVCPTGIGVGYLLFASSVECTVSSWKGKGPPAAQVAREIAAAAQTLATLVERSSQVARSSAPASKL